MKASWYHLAAIGVVAIWGTTFISTKVILNEGLSPSSIMFYRFAIAYICMWIFSRERLFANNLKDELTLMLAGLCGGTLYFVTENEALKITLASNVSLILCTAPIITMFMNRIFIKDIRLSNRLFVGSAVAMLGVGFVIYNGSNILKINPLGDILCIVAAVSWAIYTIIIKRLDSKYSITFITRKVFLYGLVCLLPMFLFEPLDYDIEVLTKPIVWGNILFLGILASFICFLVWNIIVKKLGAIQTSNYIYLSPLVTLVTAFMVLGETISGVALIGAALILTGVYTTEKR